MPETPPERLTLAPADIPAEGALGLLALGYRGLDAWRAARGTDWLADRQREWERYQIREAARAAAEKAAARESAAAEETPPHADKEAGA